MTSAHSLLKMNECCTLTLWNIPAVKKNKTLVSVYLLIPEKDSSLYIGSYRYGDITLELVCPPHWIDTFFFFIST